MIALRRSIERGVRHPVFGPLCLILLGLLLAFTVMHGAHDQMHESGELIVCLAILISAVLSLVLPQLPVMRVVVMHESRGPPSRSPQTLFLPRSALRAAPIPLRL